jgi:phosphotriesterase-related protein
MKPVQTIADLVEAGYVNHILISCDVCLKTLLHRYGGWGYDHILSHVVPMMEERGIARRHIDTILRENPHMLISI